MADFLGTIHHEFTFTVEQGIDALYDLIYHIESFEQVAGAGCRAGGGRGGAGWVVLGGGGVAACAGCCAQVQRLGAGGWLWALGVREGVRV